MQNPLKVLLLSALLALPLACSFQKPAAPLTAEQKKSREEEKQKQVQEAALRRQQYDQFQSNIRQLEVGRSSANDALTLLGKPALISGETWIYEVHPTPTDPLERYTLVFRNNTLAALSSSGIVHLQNH